MPSRIVGGFTQMPTNHLPDRRGSFPDGVSEEFESMSHPQIADLLPNRRQILPCNFP
jgi:hypothetical protein